jgi:hypothetical protein
MVMNSKTFEIVKEVGVEADKAAAQFAALDETNSINDYVAYATAYVGRISAKCPRNDREVVGSKREMAIKAAALLVRLVEKLDSGKV